MGLGNSRLMNINDPMMGKKVKVNPKAKLSNAILGASIVRSELRELGP